MKLLAEAGQRRTWRTPKAKRLSGVVCSAFFNPGIGDASFDTVGGTAGAGWQTPYLNAPTPEEIAAATAQLPFSPPSYGQITPGVVPTNAQTQAGTAALSQLTAAALSNIAKLPGQAGLQAGQTLTVGPNGTYQISAAGTQAGLSLNGTLGGSTGLLLLLGVGAVFLFMGKR